MSKILFIIGMPGVGKSHWGRALATAYNLPFFDLDLCIEEKQHTPIAQFFAEYGEAAFRKLEQETLWDIVLHNDAPFVLSCGGGTPVDPENLAFMQQHGILVHLKGSVPAILTNLKNGTNQRPLLADNRDRLTRQLETLYEKRRHVYEQADYSLAVEHLSIQDFAPILQACIRQH